MNQQSSGLTNKFTLHILPRVINLSLPEIRPDRLWSRHMDLSRIGATGRGGVNRPALGEEDSAARKQLLAWTSARGWRARIDPIGNLMIRRPGTGHDLAPVLTGSHLDTQPTGGNFDGIFGVLAGLEVMESLDDARMQTCRPVELVVWTNEEGCRFPPTTMGSAVAAGNLSLEQALAATDGKGVSVSQALASQLRQLPALDNASLNEPAFAYVEAHIEQGPLLENARVQIGAVTGIQGLYALRVDIDGFEAHAGTTPMRGRRDALVAGVSLVHRLRELVIDPEDKVRFTVGKFEVWPGSPNTVPGKVSFTIDLRHPDLQVLEETSGRILEICSGEVACCEVRTTVLLKSAPADFDPQIVELIESCASARGYTHSRIVSGATHDAKYMAVRAPTAMLFIPCEGGISHNEQESISPANAAAGAQVLCDTLVTLADMCQAERRAAMC